MNFYFIRNSIDDKIVGHYNQAINAKHNCNIWEDPKFIDRIDFIKVDFDPITSNAILEKKAKLTDLINSTGVGFGLRLLISDKLKKLLEKYSINKCQFFESPVIYNNEKLENYWVTHPFTFKIDYVDFNKSQVSVRIQKKEGGTEKNALKINSLDDFNKSNNFHRERNEIVTIEKVFLKENINDDFFMLRFVEGGLRYIVSEKLKKEIEHLNCTGIEFQPIELSQNEWMLPGGQREKQYGKT